MTADLAALSGWTRAARAAALFAVDPPGLGGVALRAFPGPARDRWLGLLRGLLPADAPIRRVPLHATDERLLGGLDLAATLEAGRPMLQRGLMVGADGGVLLISMAERVSAATAAYVAAVLDTREVALERDGFAAREPACLGVVALDEGLADEAPPPSLMERLAFHIDLDASSARELETGLTTSDATVAARAVLPGVRTDAAVVEAVCATAMALGIGSLRAATFCLRTARVCAALAGRKAVGTADVAEAVALVFGPRALMLPQAAPEPGADAAEPNAAAPAEARAEVGRDEDADMADASQPIQDVILAAARAAIPSGLLAQINARTAPTARTGYFGRAGASVKSTRRGRPIGVRRGDPPRDGRLHVLETLRAAAPWQRLRVSSAPGRLSVRRDDFRVVRTRAQSETTTIFVVDASGSAALQRLAEAKGAVETLLVDCYSRRDRVAVIAFRGIGADLLLPPTRALARARRSLAGLPGGGGTPAAAGIEAAFVLADAARRRGETPTVVVLTDGRANVALDGTPGRARAATDADAAATRLRLAGVRCLLVDTSVRPNDAARRIAAAMGARYLALPIADTRAVGLAVRAAVG